MKTFVGKAIPVVTIVRTPGKRISAKVIWKDFRFYAKVNKILYPIYDWNNVSECSYLYALPTNTYFTNWYRRPFKSNNDEDSNKMFLHFWGKYKHGMTIYGKLINDVFYESRVRRVIKVE